MDLRSRAVIDIVEVGRAVGVPASTIRYYEERGLIASVGRRGLRRLFDAAVVERLALIGLGRAAGFSLNEMALMFAPDGQPRIDRGALAAKADEIDATIAELATMRDGLRHAATCRAPSHMECPTFRRLLRAVLRGRLPRDPAPGAPRRPNGEPSQRRPPRRPR